MKYLIFLMIVLFSTSIDSVERPSAVPPPLDEEDNPTYYMAYGKGDRIDPSTNKPLNLIQIYCKEVPVDMSTCLLYTSPSPRDCLLSRMPSSA